MTDSTAYRMLTKKLDTDRDLLAREAQDAAEALTRFSQTVSSGVSTGDIGRSMQTLVRLHARAAHYEATQTAVELYEAERNITADSPTGQ
ncbi:hypothetical protein [Streptomyces sp. NPDC002640]